MEHIAVGYEDVIQFFIKKIVWNDIPFQYDMWNNK